MKAFQIGVILKAFDQLSGPFKSARASVGDFQKATLLAKNQAKAVMNTGAWKAAAAGATASAAAIGLTVKTYGDLATAQGEIASLGIQADGIKKITKAAKEFSNQWSGTTANDFISASYDIKSAISTLSDGAIAEFTRLAALTGKATKSETSTMTGLFANGYGIYRQQFEDFAASTVKGWSKLSAEEKDIKFGEYFSGGIAAVVNLFKSDGDQMAQALTNLGSSATSVGVSFAEQLAILGQAQAVYKGGSEAASGYRTFLAGVATAQEKLGMSFQDSSGQMLPMLDIIKKLKDRFGDTISVTESKKLQEAFGGTEAVKFINTFWNQTDQLSDGIKAMSGALKNGTKDVEKMAEAMNAGPNEKAALVRQQITNLSTQLGEVFAPTALKALGAISKFVMGLQKFSDTNPRLAAGLMVAATAIFSLGAAIPLIGAVWPAFTAGIKVIGPLGKLIMSFGKTFIVTMAKMAVAAATNPFTWIVLGIAAVAVGTYLLIKNWKVVSGFFSKLWGGIVKTFTGAWDRIWKALDSPLLQAALAVFAPFIGLPVVIIKNWNAISGFFSGLWRGVVRIFTTAWNSIWRALDSPVLQTLLAIFNPLLGLPVLIIKNWSSISGFFSRLWSGIKGTWGESTGWFSGLWNGILETARSVWDSITGVFTKAWDCIKGPVESVLKFFGLAKAPALSVVPSVSMAPAMAPSGTPYNGPSGALLPVGRNVSTTTTTTSKQELTIKLPNAPRGTRVDASKVGSGTNIYMGYAYAQ